MSLDLRIPGNPSSIHELADWLGHIKEAVEVADIELVNVASNASYAWQGGSATAFYNAVQALRRSQFVVPEFIGEAIEVFRAYANRLTRGYEYFTEIIEAAQAVGLATRGRWIEYPTTRLTYCPDPNAPYTAPPGPPPTYIISTNGYVPDPSLSPDVNEWNRYARCVRAYNEASRKVGAWEGELDQWLTVNMAPLVGRVQELSEVAQVYGALRLGSEFIIDAALEGAEARVELQLDEWRQDSADLSKAARDARDAARSGNPARQAAGDAFDFGENKMKIGDLEVKIGDVAHYSKVIPIVGNLIDISMAGYDISQGESESSVLVGLGGGALGGGIFAAVVSGPVGWVVLGTAAVGVLAAGGAQWLWESTVSLDTRESIDYWLEENVLWDPTTSTLVTG